MHPGKSDQGAGERAVAALQDLLAQQAVALSAGDLPGLQAVQTRLQSLLAHPAWQRDVALCDKREPLLAGLRAAVVNADLAARGEAHTARALAAMGAAPPVYGDAAGRKVSMGSGPRSGRAHHLTA